MVLAALFGKYLFEPQEPPKSNPWLEQFYQDIMMGKYTDGLYEVCEFLEQGYSYKQGQAIAGLMYNKEMRDIVLKYDFGEYKAIDKTNA
eukprot:12292367-Karenia_brevis.AAC.1